MTKERKEKGTRIVLHVLVWVVFLGFTTYSARRFRMGNSFLLTYYAFIAINAIIFYTNYLFLVPRLFLSKKRYRYYVAVLALVLGFYFISDFANEHIIHIISKNNPEQFNSPGEERRMPSQPPRRLFMPRFIIAMPNAHLIGYSASSVFMIFLSLGLRVLERQSRIEKMQEEMEKSKLNAELAFLKNQISPHFFFNTLNNIYSLIDRSNEDSKNAVIKLSKMMRYVIDESSHDKKLLSDEIEFMNNYIDLMKLRIGSKTRLSVNFTADCRDLMIPHLLFVSLIENAFKYGVSVQEESYVHISLECKGNSILFKCENGLPESNKGPIFASTGIGLENLKKRLNLLYSGRHKLKISRDKNKFEVNLFIQL